MTDYLSEQYLNFLKLCQKSSTKRPDCSLIVAQQYPYYTVEIPANLVSEGVNMLVLQPATIFEDSLYTEHVEMPVHCASPPASVPTDMERTTGCTTISFANKLLSSFLSASSRCM